MKKELKAEGFQRNFEPVANPLSICRTSMVHVHIQIVFLFLSVFLTHTHRRTLLHVTHTSSVFLVYRLICTW